MIIKIVNYKNIFSGFNICCWEGGRRHINKDLTDAVVILRGPAFIVFARVADKAAREENGEEYFSYFPYSPRDSGMAKQNIMIILEY